MDKPLWVYVVAVGIGLIVGLWQKKWDMGALVGYLFLFLAETVLVRKVGVRRYEFVPFWSWRYVIEHNSRMILEQIIMNVVAFIPIGFLLGRRLRWKSVVIAAGLSLLIELTQLITARGLFEFDDVIHNSLGAVIGVVVSRWVKKKLVR